MRKFRENCVISVFNVLNHSAKCVYNMFVNVKYKCVSFRLYIYIYVPLFLCL
jgi:hypothetical protein